MPLGIGNHVLAGASSALSVQTSAIGITTGSLILIGTNNYEGGGSSDATTPITDTAGNTYTRVGAGVGIQRADRAQVFYAKNVTGGASVQFTYTLASAGYPHIYVLEVTGADTSTPLDQGSNSSFVATTTNQTSWASPSITTTVANEILFGVGLDTNSSLSESFSDGGCTTNSGTWTSFAFPDSSSEEGGMGYAIVSATGTYCVTSTISAGASMITGIASFKAASGGGGGSVAPVPMRTLRGAGI